MIGRQRRRRWALSWRRFMAISQLISLLGKLLDRFSVAAV
jgi:hypothetical protein